MSLPTASIRETCCATRPITSIFKSLYRSLQSARVVHAAVYRNKNSEEGDSVKAVLLEEISEGAASGGSATDSSNWTGSVCERQPETKPKPQLYDAEDESTLVL